MRWTLFSTALAYQGADISISSGSVTENLHLSLHGLEEPDLDALARISAASELCKLCRLILCISVQSDSKMTYIEAIQSLSQEDQQELMQAIEETMKALRAEEEDGNSPAPQSHDRASSGDSVEKSPTKVRNGELATAHSKLVAEHEAQQAAMESMEADLVKLQARLDETVAQLEAERRKASGPEQRSELQRVTGELRKCEEALANAEAEIDTLQQQSKERNRLVSTNCVMAGAEINGLTREFAADGGGTTEGQRL